MNEGNKIFEKLVTLACALVILFVIVLTVIGNNEVTAPAPENSCEHEFVVSSKYVWWTGTYKTISTCHKCGLEV